jgi:hypothetical protein
MYACDTNELPAICKEHLKHYENVHTEDVSMICQFIVFFKEKCLGNGRLLLHIFRGSIQEYEPSSRIHKKKRST